MLQIGGYLRKGKLEDVIIENNRPLPIEIESLWNTYFPDLALNDIIPTFQILKTRNKEKLSTGE